MKLDVTKLPLGEALIGFVLTAVVGTFVLAFAFPTQSGLGDETVKGSPTPQASPTPQGTPSGTPGAAVAVSMKDNVFEPKDLTVKVGKLPSEKTAEVSPSKKKSEPGKWGLQMENLTPDLARQFGISGSRGVVVTGVVPDSPADAAGIEEGDIIREVNRHNVNSVQEAQSQVEKSKNSLLLLVQRGQGSLFAALEIK